jgi:hypothetical protein
MRIAIHNASTMTPFPVLFGDDVTEALHWPAPPFAWHHVPAPANDTPQPCLVESLAGAQVEGEMLNFDPSTRTISFRSNTNGPAVTLRFSQIRRLALTVPLRPGPQVAGQPIEPLPTAAQERTYSLQPSQGGSAIVGRTIGHVEAADGLYLFAPVDDEQALVRQFVPRTSYTSCEFGDSAAEAAAARWVTTPEDLLEALERQRHMPVPRMGQSLLALGLLTQSQLDRTLAGLQGDQPLGEALVAAKIISPHDLQTAIAFKMGYPYVDLSRFPIDPEAARRLPAQVAVRARVVPLMLDNQRLIVAIEDPALVSKLATLMTFAKLQVVPVLATQSQIVLALSRLTLNDAWSSSLLSQLPPSPPTGSGL